MFLYLVAIGFGIAIIAIIPYIIYLVGVKFGKKISALPQTEIVSLPNISIVICSYKEERNIGKKIQSISDCSYPNDKIEVVIVIDQADDNTEGVARDTLEHSDLSWKIHVNNERTGKNKSLNIGMGMASNDIIIDTDADVIWDTTTVEMLVRRLVSEEKIAAVSADLQPYAAADRVTSMEMTYRSYFGRMSEWESANDATYIFNGNLIALKKSVIDGITEFIGPDDANIAFVAIRKGYRTIYDTQAKVYEELPENMSKQYSQKARRAKGLIQATLANRDLLKLKRPFSKLFYPLRIWMYVITPTLFFIGAGAFVIGLFFVSPLILLLLLLALALISLVWKGNLLTSFITNQLYLLAGLYSPRKDAVIWESTSKKVGE
ncbi:MAG: glycosyltransferase [Methanocalculaceae archaeon]|jgi:cellulose synthase/poly-beta-1,6-N-acetylglucosamine synthase-like glycosyltransferase|nr:glycosyltransferase [Methanocalculaceae archaeon]